MSDTTVACVYKTDPEALFSPEYVERLMENVREHTTREHEFVCLTDTKADLPCRTIRLTENLPRQWSKLELFKPGQLTGRVIYFDLDTIILKNIDKLMDYDGSFAMLRCWKKDTLASGIMAWNGEHTYLFPTPGERIRIDKAPPRGDQVFIKRMLGKHGTNPDDVDRIDDMVKTASYRWHVRISGVGDAAIVCFHGPPRPKEIGWKL